MAQLLARHVSESVGVGGCLASNRGQELLTLSGQTGRVFATAFGPDGYRLASTTREGAVQIWEATPRETGVCLRTTSVR